MCAQPFKDNLNPEAVRTLAARFAAAAPDFDGAAFTAQACDGLEALELKDRVRHIIAALHDRLPGDYPRALAAILRVGEAWPPNDGSDPNAGFLAWPVIDYIGAHGLAHPEASLDGLRRITQLFSAEFAIRPFLVEHRDLTLRRLEAWTRDDSEHVRRLVSEGTRPRLPWGLRLKDFQADPTPTLALLERLRDDPSDYVRRSVANHLNDVSKDHPRLALEVSARWLEDADEKRRGIVRHALRGLLRARDPGALGLMGFGTAPQVSVEAFALARERLKVGEALGFGFRLVSRAKASQKLLIEYLVHHRKAKGGTSPKAFRLAQFELAPGRERALEKRHSFRPVTTRRYYPGEHALELVINGQSFGRLSFQLEAPGG